MNVAELQHFPLKDAYLCQSCQHIGNSACWCPFCKADQMYLMSIAKVLDRVTEPVGAKEGSIYAETNASRMDY